MSDFLGPLSHHIHASTSIPYSRAQKWINAYTARSQQHPHMHPDAQLSRKITFGTNGASGGLTLTQLRKVSKGLGGERLTPEPEEPPKDKKGSGKKRAGENDAVKGVDGTNEEDWQDADAWAAERDGDEDGVDELVNGDRHASEVPTGEAPEVEEVPRGGEKSRPVDKAERKRLKKEKRKAETKERESKRRKGAED